MTQETKADYARRHGVSRPAVQKWEKAGWLALVDGKVDVEASDAKLAKYRDSKDGRATVGKRKPAASKPATVNALDGESPQQAAERIVRTLGADMPIEEAKRLKENYLALVLQLEYQQKDGALVDLSLAEQVLFEATRGARDAWLNFPTKVGPQLAAQLGLEADKVTEALSAYVHKQIAELGEPEADFSER
jgi:hypothetical protein